MKNELKILNIEPTNKCNIEPSCYFCSDDGSRERGFIPITLYMHILDQFVNMHDNNKELRLFVSGEPTLHPHIVALVKIASEFKIQKIMIHTNGLHLIYRNYIINQMVEAGLTHLSFSLDAQTCSQYNQYRKPITEAEFDNLLATVEHASTFVSLKVTAQIIRPYPSYLGYTEEFRKKIGKNTEIFVRYPHSWAKKGLIPSAVPLDYPETCFFLDSYMSILWNGDLVACCADLNGEMILSNFNKVGIIECWNKIQIVRQSQIDKKYIPLCSQCERYNTGETSGDEVVGGGGIKV